MKSLGWVWILLLAALLNLAAAHPRRGKLPTVDRLSENPVSISAPFPFTNVAAELNRINAALRVQ